MGESANIARHLPLMAARQPDHPAVKIPRGRTDDGRIDYLALSFRELDAEAAARAAHLATHGVRRGDRVLVLVRQGLPLIASVFALFRLGAVPIVIDPGMGRKQFLTCVARSRPRALLGIPLAQVFSHVFRSAFASVEARVWISGSPTARAPRTNGNPPAVAESSADELAAILFTSGSTGAPKGVCYEHGMFEAQVRLIRETYGIQPGEVDLPMLPVFALFNPALGMTTIVPEIDPSRPATVDPAKIVQAIQQEGVTNSFGSPTLWRKIAAHAKANGVSLPSMKRVLMAGAPVPPSLFESVQTLLPNGTAHSPYGATEALPLASIAAKEVLGETATLTARGAGACVGRPIGGVSIKIIRITSQPIADLASAEELPVGEIGEIVVTGPSVTKAYDSLPEATAAAKIQQGGSTTWHRMGDAGYLDATGRLWFCGRVIERVLTADGPLYTEQVEPIFNAHPDVRRTALIGLGEPGRQRPAIVVEPRSRECVGTPSLRRKLVRELRALGAAHPQTDRIRLAFLHPAFPVDVRHNAKIHRLTLAKWAARHHGYELDRRDAIADLQPR
jgi:acyl-CoA synthetase (AMP-forming)/AMP-acid ligase II